MLNSSLAVFLRLYMKPLTSSSTSASKNFSHCRLLRIAAFFSLSRNATKAGIGARDEKTSKKLLAVWQALDFDFILV